MAPRQSPSSSPVRVVLATTTLIAFVSSWRAAALTLVEIGGVAFFASGAAERALGEGAAWFVLFAVLAGIVLRAIDLESCALFLPGGLYGTVREALGTRAARVAAAAQLVDHLLLGALAAVVAGHYVTLPALAFLNVEQMEREAAAADVSVAIAIALVALVWWRQRQGRSFSSQIVTRVVSGAVVVLAMVMVSAVVTVALRGGHPPSFPSASSIRLPSTSPRPARIRSVLERACVAHRIRVLPVRAGWHGGARACRA